MAAHLFRIGQLVTIGVRAEDARRVGARLYKVVCLLPPIGGSHAYRLKAIMEPEPRVALEADCKAADTDKPIFCIG